mmetsp:Transcript_35627/g.100866  ORF Transcript_35627/g.100866 Transcript_35627/m.100866 type:complete len:247 (-) Transcript_35627:159-899(-)
MAQAGRHAGVCRLDRRLTNSCHVRSGLGLPPRRRHCHHSHPVPFRAHRGCVCGEPSGWGGPCCWLPPPPHTLVGASCPGGWDSSRGRNHAQRALPPGLLLCPPGAQPRGSAGEVGWRGSICPCGGPHVLLAAAPGLPAGAAPLRGGERLRGHLLLTLELRSGCGPCPAPRRVAGLPLQGLPARSRPLQPHRLALLCGSPGAPPALLDVGGRQLCFTPAAVPGLPRAHRKGHLRAGNICEAGPARWD